MDDSGIEYLTKEGYAELEARLKYLKSEGILEVAKKIEAARAFGDISENSEYDAAREEEAQLHEEINKIELQLRNAKIIKKSRGDTITVGSTVDVKFSNGDVETYKITGSFESDPTKNLISNESPMGVALLGHKEGDVVTVAAGVTYKLTIVDVK